MDVIEVGVNTELLASVREAWNDPLAYVYKSILGHWRAVAADSSFEYATEKEALVAALKAAPKGKRS